MEQLWDDIARAYDRSIQAPGKELHFLVLMAFVLSFGFIRTSAHMIRAQVSWWPGNVETKGGTHVHHLVWGILLLLSMGYLGISTDQPAPGSSSWRSRFGIGMGLTLDEFALWLNLEDVYWSEKGRQSIDAVVVTTCAARDRAARASVLDRRRTRPCWPARRGRQSSGRRRDRLGRRSRSQAARRGPGES